MLSKINVDNIFTSLERVLIFLDGCTYERSAIESWFSLGNKTSPMTNEPVNIKKLTPNIELQEKIIQFIRGFRRVQAT